jgi:large subunit ribosomal protein L6
MSRIGKMPIDIPANVNVEISGKTVSVKGPLGEDSLEVIDGISVAREENFIKVVKEDENSTDKTINSYFGLFRSLISNMVRGVTTGFEKELEIIGVGYRANQQNKNIQFQLGFSHDIIFEAPEGIVLEVTDQTKVKVKGFNKQQVGQVAANIRKLRPPEPYKGKGIRYKDEYVRKKAGKAGK